MTDAGQGLASEAIGANCGQVLEGLELGRGESLAKKRKVVFLDSWSEDACSLHLLDPD